MGEILSRFSNFQDTDVGGRIKNNNTTKPNTRRPQTVCSSEYNDGVSTRYDFKFPFKVFKVLYKQKESKKFTVGEVDFTISFDLNNWNRSGDRIIQSICVTCQNMNVTFVNGQMFTGHTSNTLYNLYVNMQQFSKPVMQKLKPVPFEFKNESTLEYIHQHPGYIEFLFVGSVLVNPSFIDEMHVFLLNNKLKSAPTFLSQERLLIDSENKPEVILQVGERKFHAHKEVLSQRSNVFQAMFKSDTKENQTGVIIIDDLDEEVVEEMILFIYTDTSPRIKELARYLLPAADKYFLEKLKLMCELELVKGVNQSNICEFLYLADMYNAENLRHVIKKYIQEQTANRLSKMTIGGMTDLHCSPKKYRKNYDVGRLNFK